MELDSQDPTGCEVHNTPTNPPGISISLTSPYINIALNTPLLVDSFGSPGSSCCLTLSNGWSDFDFGLITEKPECETFKTRSGSSTSYCTMRHQKIEQSRKQFVRCSADAGSYSHSRTFKGPTASTTETRPSKYDKKHKATYVR
uniref:Expressed conserved protein n=1 Tax=Echinococcus granulosus TaxID=6210 RepID=A0A068WMR0_ECHGR|nr:hypothetical protein EgrG_000423600 [Echinococcus granulosus]